MAKKNGDARVEVRHAGGGQRQGHRADTVWHRACRDAERCTRVYSAQSPSPTLQARGWGVVYVMRDAEGLCKIGFSTNLPRRIVDLQRGLWGGSRPICLMRAVQLPTSAVWAVESRVRRALKSRRHHGEWFCVTSLAMTRAIFSAMRQLRAETSWKFEV